MGSVRPWHYILFGAAFVALGVGLYFSMKKEVDLADRVVLVDVLTGDRYAFDISGRKMVAYPETNPDTGQRTLIGVEEIDGKTVVRDRQRDLLREIMEEYDLSPEDLVVDLTTYEIRVSESPIRKGR